MAKGPHAFRTISEAADELGVPQHVLRFWESRFSFIRPMKRAGGRRFYRPQDIEVLAGVRALLHGEGYTIKGVQQLHKEFGLRRIIGAPIAETAHDHFESYGEDTSLPDESELHDEIVEDEVADDEVAAEPASEPTRELAAPASRGLKPEARRRLTRALDDLTQVQAHLDALLRNE